MKNFNRKTGKTPFIQLQLFILYKLACLLTEKVSRKTTTLDPPGYFRRTGTMYGLLTKCEVKMAGYWPSSFFHVFMDRYEVEVHKLAKKDRGQYPAILTEQTWSIKDLLYGF